MNQLSSFDTFSDAEKVVLMSQGTAVNLKAIGFPGARSNSGVTLGGIIAASLVLSETTGKSQDECVKFISQSILFRHKA